MYREHHAGAPRGGRVHWLIWNLRPDFKRAYECFFNYASHRYVFYRIEKKKIYDVFIVYQTSRHCWRCMYANTKTADFEYFSHNSSRHIALRMWFIYRKMCDRIED